MKDIESRFEQQVDPLELVAAEQKGETLGAFSAAWDWITRKPTHEVLREALQKLKKDQSFVLQNPDSPYHRIDELMGTGFDYVIAGHTHQERIVPRGRGRGTYFNSGTWVALMRFTDSQLSSDAEFKGVFENLKSSRTIAEIEQHAGLIERKPAVVSITQVSGAVRAQLQRVSLAQGRIDLKDVGAEAGGS
jgi:hypothetical protein